MRGGSGVIFNNTCNGIYTNIHALTLTRDDTYPVEDCYIWNNLKDGVALTTAYITNSGYTQNTDFFMYKKPDYHPYYYPHPLRNS